MARRGRKDGAAGPGLKLLPAPSRARRRKPAAECRTSVGREGARADADAALAERIARVRRGLYELHSDLVYFVTSPEEHRERLRDALEWPDVGHITSLARALAEEQRFADWARFNGYVRSA